MNGDGVGWIEQIGEQDPIEQIAPVWIRVFFFGTSVRFVFVMHHFSFSIGNWLPNGLPSNPFYERIVLLLSKLV